jgi:hypothetical protein
MTLGVWSAVLLGTYFSGRVASFLHPSFRPGVLWAGVGLAALALLFASRPTPPECCSDETCTHPLSRTKAGRWTTFLILVLPVSVAAWLSPEQFSRQAFEQRAEVTDASSLGERQRKLLTGAQPQNAPAEQSPAPALSPATATQSDAAPGTPPPSATTAAPASTAADAEAIPEYLQKTPEGYIVAEVLDLLYAARSEEHTSELQSQRNTLMIS